MGTEAGLVEDLYVDAQGLSDKALTTDLQKELRGYIRGVVDQEWPEQRAGSISMAAAPALRLRETLASFQPKTSGDAIVMQEMLHALNELYNARRDHLEAAGGHIPDAVWWLVIFLGLLTVAFTALLDVHNPGNAFCDGCRSDDCNGSRRRADRVQLGYPFRGAISVSADPFESVFSDVGARQELGEAQ